VQRADGRLEDDPEAQTALGIDIRPVADWFSPFNDSWVVHPYAETSSSVPVVHDLYLRFGASADLSVLYATKVVGAEAQIAGFLAGSELVALMRQGLSRRPASGSPTSPARRSPSWPLSPQCPVARAAAGLSGSHTTPRIPSAPSR
jgi:hypothetical protein